MQKIIVTLAYLCIASTVAYNFHPNPGYHDHEDTSSSEEHHGFHFHFAPENFQRPPSRRPQGRPLPTQPPRGQQPFRGQGQQPSRGNANGGQRSAICGNNQQRYLNLFKWEETPDSCTTASSRAAAANLTGVARDCSKQEFFYGLNPRHMHAVENVEQLLLGARNCEEMLDMAGALRDRREINPHVWVNGLLKAGLAREDVRELHKPPLVQIMPGSFINRESIAAAKQGQNQCVRVDGRVSGRDNGVENALWYFREDVMVNANHWYWHLQNPFLPTLDPTTGRNSSRPDRRGELFYYFHHGIIARYHTERVANGLPRLQALEVELGRVIEEPYFTHLDDSNSGMRWQDRPANTRIQDIRDNPIDGTPNIIIVNTRLAQVRRIEDSIRKGTLLTSTNREIPINNARGIDQLGETVEASSLYSGNPDYYGRFGVHNEAHLILGLTVDPNNQRRLPPGVMTDGSTAMRDPVFYRYHLQIADLFDQHKNRLPPYTPDGGELPLRWPGVTLTSVQVLEQNAGTPNALTTFFTDATFDLSRGLDFNRSGVAGPIMACIEHLDHTPFEYQLVVENARNSQSTSASFRIFIAPRFNEKGQRYTMVQQRDLFFVLDFFRQTLKPGKNVIRRRSEDSALTVPWPQRIQELERNSTQSMPNCGCGWPANMLLPKGNEQGMLFDLFVMVTNGEEDAVRKKSNTPSRCREAFLYCGLNNEFYPDAKPMGYPFDRLPYNLQQPRSPRPVMVQNLDEYVNGISNMKTTQVRITHVGERNKPNGPIQFGNQPGRQIPNQSQSSYFNRRPQYPSHHHGAPTPISQPWNPFNNFNRRPGFY